MDHAVALVEAYLQINGYFTVAEYPVIESLGSGRYATATDLDILGIRFPGAGRLVPGKGDAILFEPDPALGVSPDQSDMLIGEVKEGRAEFNRAVRNPHVLRTVIARFGCCAPEHANDVAQELIRKGLAITPTGHRVRLMAFGSIEGEPGFKRYGTITLGHIVEFIEGYLREHWEVLRHSEFSNPALGLFMVLEKARLEAAAMKR